MHNLAALPDRWVVAAGLRTRFREAGDGPPLVLLHGIGGHLGFWEACFAALAARFRTIAVDVCGFGASEAPGEVSRAAFREWLAEVLDGVGARRAAVAASSLGASVALALAIEEPERFSALALVGSASLGRNIGFSFRAASIPMLGERILGSDPKSIRRDLLRLTCRQDWVWEGLLEETACFASLPGPSKFFFRSLRWGVSFLGGMKANAVLLDELHKLSMPVLLLWGRQDPVFPLRDAERAAARVPDAELKILEDCGHMPHMERPAEFAELLIDFLVRRGVAAPTTRAAE